MLDPAALDVELLNMNMQLLKPAPASSSRIPAFYRLDVARRHQELRERFGLSDADVATLRGAPGQSAGLTLHAADTMVENCVGVLGIPVGLGLNFTVNGRDYVVPMAVEEPSVVAAVSHAAKLVRESGGFVAEADASIMIGQLQVLDVPDPAAAQVRILRAREELLAIADAEHPGMSLRGAGPRGIEVRLLPAPYPMMVVHLLVDCCDAMGANVVNTMTEALAPHIERLSGGRVNLRILSNLADRRCARARCRVPVDLLAGCGVEGARAATDIEHACRFAAADPYRAATGNKGVMNGIDAVAIATGNDWRSLEAGAHAFAARGGRYTSLTRWRHADGHLEGRIELPMAVGTVGGATKTHPTIAVLRKILGVRSARELGMVMAAVGLAQNLGALKALATEGIQRGHMSLHARRFAAEAADV